MPQPVLLDLNTTAYSHQEEVDEVRRRIGVTHHYFDCWLYGFLENKSYNINETVSKLQRRDDFERNELANHEMTEWMMENMQKGTIQIIGNDRDGRVTFYIVTVRDKPTSAKREESRKNFDMWLSYGSRLRKENKRCQITMLINQDKSSMWSNLDMTFQADVALRIAKFYPGCVDKMYVCKMNRTLTTLAKPIFSRLPRIVSDRIQIISEGDIKSGKLLEYFDEDVLPLALGGTNDCDNQDRWTAFATTISDHFTQLKQAVKERGMSVKEWELECLRNSGDITDDNPPAVIQPSINVPQPGDDSLSRNASFARLQQGNDERQSSQRGGGAIRTRPSTRNEGRSSPSLHSLPAGSPGGKDDDWYSCGSSIGGESEFSTGKHYRPRDPSLAQAAYGIPCERRNLMSEYMEQFWTLETFFRRNIEEMHEREWLTILQRGFAEQNELQQREGVFDGATLISAFPVPLQFIARGFVWTTLMVMSFFFFLGALFIGVLSASILIYIFFAALMEPYNIFPYGCAFLVTSYQFALFSTRSLDILSNTVRGKLFDGFSAFGAKALIPQSIIYVGCIIAFFVVFCVMAARYDPLTGFQYSLAIGWIVAVCITIIYHFFYSFGIKQVEKRKKHDRSREDHAEASVYLFLDVEMEDHQLKHSATTELLLLLVPMVIGFVFGLAYIFSNKISFLCIMCVCTICVQIMSSVFFMASSPSSTAALLTTSITYGCIFWMYTVFTLSTYGWGNGWGKSVLTSLFLMLFMNAVSFASVSSVFNGAARRWMFRVAWFVVLAHGVGCVVSLFIKDYRIGLFVLALAFHLVLYAFRAVDAASTKGICMVAVGFLTVLLACILLGSFHWSNESYISPFHTGNGTNTIQSARFNLDGAVLAQRTSTGSFNFRDADSTQSSVETLNSGLQTFTDYMSQAATGIAAALYQVGSDMGFSSTGAKDTCGDDCFSATNGNVSPRSPRDGVYTGVQFGVCAQRFPPELDVFDFALFSKLAKAKTDAVREADLHAWFPSYHYAGQLSLPSNSVVAAHIFIDDSAEAEEKNSTTAIISFIQTDSPLGGMNLISMWITPLIMSFMQLVMPTKWYHQSLFYIAFMSAKTPQRWRDTLEDVRAALLAFKQETTIPTEEPAANTTSSSISRSISSTASISATIALPDLVTPVHHAYITGIGPAAALAAVAGTQEQLPSVIFAAPDLYTSSHIFSLRSADIYSNVVSVVSENTLLLGNVGHGPGVQVIPCDYSAKLCDKLESIVSILGVLCNRTR